MSASLSGMRSRTCATIFSLLVDRFRRQLQIGLRKKRSIIDSFFVLTEPEARFCMCHGHVVNNAIQPRGEFAVATIGMQIAVSLYEAFLHDIFRILHVVAYPVGYRESHVLIGFDKIGEGGSIAGEHLLYPLSFVHRQGLILLRLFLNIFLFDFLRKKKVYEISNSQKYKNCRCHHEKLDTILQNKIFDTQNADNDADT